MYSSSILVNSLDVSQLSISLCKNLNEVLTKTPYLDTIVYYQTWGKLPFAPQFAMLMEREFWGAQGVAISTDIKTTEKLIKCPGPTKKFFYVWNLEWLNMQNIDYDRMNNVYNNDGIELIARSIYHAALLEMVWKKPAFIMEDFEPETLKKILYDSQI